MNKTFAMIKPCAQARGVTSFMKADIDAAGFHIEQEKELTLTREQAEWLYREHSEKGHFNDLVDFTISGPVTLLVLSSEGDNVPAQFRELMGPTDISKAPAESLRGKYAEDFRRNSIHGSDGNESAAEELAYFASSF